MYNNIKNSFNMSSFDFNRKYQPVKVQRRSAFNKNHRFLLTTKCGTITPLLCDELIGNSTVHLDAAINACLPPLASPAFMNVGLEVNAFFVPTRLLYGGWENWCDSEKVYAANGNELSVTIPVCRFSSAATTVSLLGPGTLCDYLGYRISSNDLGTPANFAETDFNIFPLLAYHRIYSDWYLNTNVQKNPFRKNVQGTSAGASYPGLLPTTIMSGSTPVAFKLNDTFFDGKKLGELRQRNFDLDLYTSALPSAQRGDPQVISMTADLSGKSEFTIASLRAGTALQTWAEKLGYSTRYQDWVKVNFGAHLSDGMAQRTLYLGRQYIPVYSKGVMQTQNGGDTSNNPFNTIGAEYGNAICVGKGNLVKSFTAQEPGYLVVLATLVPEVTYSSGVDRQNFHYTSQSSLVDMANATLQHVGNQPIYQGELCPIRAVSADGGTSVFAYSDRYYEYMTKPSHLAGLVRDGSSLQSFALQRSFFGTSPVTLTSSFLTIPTSYLDQVAAAQNTISNYGCWIDCYFRYTVIQPLAQYSTPCIIDPATEHGKTEHVKKGGRSVY